MIVTIFMITGFYGALGSANLLVQILNPVQDPHSGIKGY